MEQDRIKERLLKMYRLAVDGVDGEKETAQKMLEANLAKYGLTMDDLVESDSNEKKKIYWFTAKKRSKQDKKNGVCNMSDAELKKHLKTF